MLLPISTTLLIGMQAMAAFSSHFFASALPLAPNTCRPTFSRSRVESQRVNTGVLKLSLAVDNYSSNLRVEATYRGKFSVSD